ncbi:MAG TPA: UGSC family (seleno)protein [Casimicrobiaceae bacterium]|nr:UGSC family (seleno)protein [Casimicrobiaceae bacterium]
MSAVAEIAGIPTVSLVCEGFVGQAKTSCAGLGVAQLPIAVVPGHVDVQTNAELERNIVGTTVGQVIEALTTSATLQRAVAEPAPDEIAFEGSFDAVNRHFYENQWSDGLPIVPPTRERIEAFLRFTDRPADTLIGTMLPDKRAATVWNVAVNGVMAGCRPEYMPILVALVDAMADPTYGVEHSGNTPGAETQIVINGPLIKQLGFNYEQGALRDGVQPNTAIGRFWRLYLRNVAGFLLHQNDKGTFGGTWRVVMAENEDTLAEIGWPTFASSNGLSEAPNAVTIARYTGSHVVASVFGKNAEECVPYLADALVKYTGWELIFTVGFSNGTYRPLLVLSPIIARTIAKSGVTKAGLQQMLFDQARMPAALFEKYISGWTNIVPGRRSLTDMVALGKAPKIFGASRDPNRLVPIVLRPDHIMIAVSGDPWRTNCYVMTHNGMLGFPTSKRIELPQDWEAKVRDG